MKKLLIATGAILLAIPASAQEFTTVYGEYVNLHQVADATNAAVDFGFRSDRVDICTEDDSARVYMRLGDTLPTNATSSANFINGVSGGLPGQALPIFQSGDGTDVLCVSIPLQANGIVLHSAGAASVDVRAYAE